VPAIAQKKAHVSACTEIMGFVAWPVTVIIAGNGQTNCCSAFMIKAVWGHLIVVSDPAALFFYYYSAASCRVAYLVVIGNSHWRLYPPHLRTLVKAQAVPFSIFIYFQYLT
jgi:hypothetical protein